MLSSIITSMIDRIGLSRFSPSPLLIATEAPSPLRLLCLISRKIRTSFMWWIATWSANTNKVKSMIPIGTHHAGRKRAVFIAVHVRISGSFAKAAVRWDGESKIFVQCQQCAPTSQRMVAIDDNDAKAQCLESKQGNQEDCQTPSVLSNGLKHREQSYEEGPYLYLVSSPQPGVKGK